MVGISLIFAIYLFQVPDPEHSNNKCKSKVTQKKYSWHGNILNKKKMLSILKLPSWPRKRELDLKLSILKLKRCFMSVQNKMTPILAYLRIDVNFLKNAWEFNRGVTWRSELKWDVSNSVQIVTVLWVVFLVNIFAPIAQMLSGIHLNGWKFMAASSS